MSNNNEEGNEEIVFDDSYRRTKIHPAIDAIDGIFYFGFQLPVRTAGDAIKDGLCFVSSNRKVFGASERQLAIRNLELITPNVIMSLRWSLQDMEAYLHKQYENADYSMLPFEIYRQLKQYVELQSQGCYLLIPLWIIGTYLQPIWNSYPYFSVSGTKRTGKSKLLKFIQLLAFSGLFSTSISTASLYRLIQNLRPTLLLDESEKYSNVERQQEIRNIINSGYNKYGKVYRSGKARGDKIIQEQFEVFCPKAIVAYKGLEEVTEDRCIPITMIRSANEDIVNQEINQDDPSWQHIRNKLYHFALYHFQDIQNLYNTLEIDVPSKNYMSRERELWRPIFTLASYFKIRNRIIPYAVAVMEDKRLEDVATSKELHLLETLYKLVTKETFYASSDIKAEMIELHYPEIPAWLTSQWIGNTLSRQFGFKRRSTTKERHRSWLLDPKTVRDLCLKYGVDIDIDTQTSLTR